MTTFKSLNQQLFRQKRHYANLVLCIQLFAIIFLSILTLVNDKDMSSTRTVFGIYFSGKAHDYWAIPCEMAIITTIFADLLFAGLMCWQNEKINNSQTFQLIPFSTNQTWLTNLFSSLLACAYLFVIQVIFCWLSFIPSEIYAKRNIFVDTVKVLIDPRSNDYWSLLQDLEYLVVLTLLIFIAVTFVNYASTIICEHLPIKNTQWVRILLIGLITILGLYIALQIDSHLTDYYIIHTTAVRKHGGEFIVDDPMWLSNLEIIAGDIVFGALDLWLGHKYWEPKRDH